MHTKKIYIIGAPGSGKSYLAKKLSSKFEIPHFDLDNVFWKTKYTVKRSENEKKRLFSKIIQSNKGWIIEGAFSSFIDKALTGADEVIWLDIHPNIISWRIFSRFVKNFRNRTESLQDVYNLIKFARSYKREDGMFYRHKAKVEKQQIEFISIQNRKELENYLKLQNVFKKAEAGRRAKTNKSLT